MAFEYLNEDNLYHEDWLERADAYIDAGKLVIPQASSAQSLKVLKLADEAFKYFVFNHLSKDLRKKYSDKGIRNYFSESICYVREELNGCILPGVELVELRPSLSCFLDYLCAINEPELNKAITEHKNIFSFDKIDALKKMAEKEDETFKRRARKNRASIHALVRSVYQVRARVLVLRLDLAYRHDGCVLKDDFGETWQAIKEDIDLVCQHRDQFIKYLKVRFPKGLLGYIWRLEYGVQKGYHLHTLLLLDGNLHHKDETLCKELGEKWNNEITDKQGVYYNCNARKSSYRNLAIGMTSYSNLAQQSGIDNIVNYFVKDDWIFQVRSGRGHRTIGRTEIPKQVAIPRGRKRSC